MNRYLNHGRKKASAFYSVMLALTASEVAFLLVARLIVLKFADRVLPRIISFSAVHVMGFLTIIVQGKLKKCPRYSGSNLFERIFEMSTSDTQIIATAIMFRGMIYYIRFGVFLESTSLP